VTEPWLGLRQARDPAVAAAPQVTGLDGGVRGVPADCRELGEPPRSARPGRADGDQERAVHQTGDDVTGVGAVASRDGVSSGDRERAGQHRDGAVHRRFFRGQQRIALLDRSPHRAVVATAAPDPGQ